MKRRNGNRSGEFTNRTMTGRLATCVSAMESCRYSSGPVSAKVAACQDGINSSAALHPEYRTGTSASISPPSKNWTMSLGPASSASFWAIASSTRSAKA